MQKDPGREDRNATAGRREGEEGSASRGRAGLVQSLEYSTGLYLDESRDRVLNCAVAGPEEIDGSHSPPQCTSEGGHLPQKWPGFCLAFLALHALGGSGWASQHELLKVVSASPTEQPTNCTETRSSWS